MDALGTAAVLLVLHVKKMYSDHLRASALSMLSNGVERSKVHSSIGVKRTQLKRWEQYYADSGSVWRNVDRHNKHHDACRYDRQLMDGIIYLVRTHPQALLREHSQMLKVMSEDPEGDMTRLRYSKSTVDRHLHRLGFTRKKILRLFRESSEERRRQHAVVRQRIPRRCIVSVDETHTDGSDVFRLYGRSLTHERSRLLDRDPRSVPRTSTTMAVSSDGRILGFMSVVVRERALTGADWRLFLQHLFPKLGVYTPGAPWHLQPDNCVVMFDNAPIHDADGDAFMTANGVSFLRLPPYSPDMQPIEGVFNDLKVIIRNLVYQNPALVDDPHLLQALAASFLSQRHIVGQFDRVDRVLAAVRAQ